jgi:hypothetical protein
MLLVLILMVRFVNSLVLKTPTNLLFSAGMANH